MSSETERLTEVIGMLKARADADKLESAIDMLYAFKAKKQDSDAKRYADSERLQTIGKDAASSLADMVAALECDYDRLAELRQLRQPGPVEVDNPDDLSNDELFAELAELEKQAGDCESREDAEQRIHEDPLSIELSGTWVLGEKPTADKAIILLSTGGPAVRIVCKLNEDMEPHRAWLQTQDWFLPWTDVIGVDDEMLLTYCRQFYFGEG